MNQNIQPIASTPAAMDHAGLFENSPNPYLVLDRSLNIAGANKAYLASVKRELIEILGRWAWDAFPTDPETERQAVASFERVIRTRQPDTMALLRFDVPKPEAEGGGFDRRYWSIVHIPILDGDGEVSLVLQHPIDVTELETLREAASDPTSGLQPSHVGIFDRARSVSEQNMGLKADRERLQRMFAKAPSFMAMLSGPDHVFELANDAYVRLVGQRDVVGRTVAEALPEAVSQGFVELLDGVYRSGKAYTTSGMRFAVQPTPDGPVDERYLDFVYQPMQDESGRTTGIFVEGFDITERLEASAAVSAGEARNRQILDSAIDYAIVATDLSGNVTRWNVGAERVLGWTEEEMLGQSAERFFTPEDVAAGRIETEMRSALETGRGNDERWHQRKGGERFYAVGEMTVLRDADGGAAGFVKVLRDRTAEKLEEEADRAAAARASFLLNVEERLRPLSSANDIIDAAAEALGRHLGVDQVAYAVVDESGQQVVIEHEWNSGAIPSNAGTHEIEAFGGSFEAALRAGETIVVADVRSDPLTAAPHALSAFESVSVRSFLNHPIVKDGRLMSVFAVHSHVPRNWSQDEVKLACEVAERVWASAARAKAETDLRESEAYVRLLMESTAEGFYAVDRDGLTTTCNAAFLRMLGFSSVEEVVGRRLHGVIHHTHPDGTCYDVADCPIYVCAREGKPAHVTDEVFFKTDGTTIPVEYWVHPIVHGDTLQGAVCTFLDITERRQAEGQRLELMQEMSHRIKNVLAMVQSIATQTFRSAASLDEARDAVAGRIAALASAQDILMRTAWEASPVSDIVTTALAPHRGLGADRFLVSGPAVDVTSQQGLGLSLALHELATNAAKYGALSTAGGIVSVTWEADPDGSFRFDWRESGGPPVAPPTRSGFGSRLVERLVAAYFEGSTELAFDPNGVRFTLSGRVQHSPRTREART